MTEYIREIGELVWIDFDPQKGSEIQKRRPALAISPQLYNKTVMNLALFCPITSTRKGNPFEVDIPEGLEIKGVILADQVKSMDWRQRKATFICDVPEETVHKVLRRVEALLGIMESFELKEIWKTCWNGLDLKKYKRIYARFLIFRWKLLSVLHILHTNATIGLMLK